MNLCFPGVLTQSRLMELNIFPGKCFAKNFRFRRDWFEGNDRYCRFYQPADQRELAAICAHINDKIAINYSKRFPMLDRRRNAKSQCLPALRMDKGINQLTNS